MTIRNVVIILFGAGPALFLWLTMPGAGSVLGLAAALLASESSFFALLWLICALWGTASIWFALASPIGPWTAIGLVAGLTAMVPVLYNWFIASNNIQEALLVRGWTIGPPVVAVVLIVSFVKERFRGLQREC